MGTRGKNGYKGKYGTNTNIIFRLNKLLTIKLYFDDWKLQKKYYIDLLSNIQIGEKKYIII